MNTAPNTDWENIPHTDPKATVISHRKIVDTLAIRIISGSIRDAVVCDEVFEIADNPQPFGIHDGVLRAEVKCFWYARKPPSSWMHIKLLGDWELIHNYSGEVADNIQSWYGLSDFNLRNISN